MDKISDHELVSTTDARVWAQQFILTVSEHPQIPTDEGTMTGWFANAIEAGRGAGLAASSS